MTPENDEKRPVTELDYKPVKKVITDDPPATTTDDQKDEKEKSEPEKKASEGGVIATVTETAEKIQRRPMIAHLLRATERFNDRLGNQFGAAITYFSFL